ncbi:MAG: tRNA (adenosine(37)-N6)-threonylcarbamoyltransferase complex transferase subunit TsaD [Candidatus Peribacteraceae bacterium]
MRILGIESSCDETSAAVVEGVSKVLSCVIASSRKDFELVGGVIPEEAARRQQETILPTIEKALRDAGMTLDQVDAIAVTHGPGLLGSLLVGTMTARALAHLARKPLIPVHHIAGHLASTWLDQEDEPTFPILTLSVSGGHTELRYRTSVTEHMLVATTLDDAAGEAFDKGAQMLGLPYPGGPALAKLALSGDPLFHDFPVPAGDQFSFSGLKTSLKYWLRDHPGDTSVYASIAASYERAITEQLVRRTESTLAKFPDTKELHIVGGVSANLALRKSAASLCERESLKLRVPTTLRYCTDNAAMIAAAAALELRSGKHQTKHDWKTSAQLPL